MSLHNEWNRPETNKNFMNPTRVVGDVLVNGIIDRTQVIHAVYNQAPLYPMPHGMTVQDIETVRRGDIVYNIIQENRSNQLTTSNYNSSNDNTTVSALSSLNGQGTKGQRNIMQKILPMGLAYMETDVNKEPRYNIHIGGVHTTINNGDRVINTGDWVMAYAPTVDEVERGSGGRGKIADKNKLVTLWFRPYDPSIHKVSPKQIYECLKQIEAGNDRDSDYLESYKTQCKSFVDSSLNMSMVVMNAVSKNPSLMNQLRNLDPNNKGSKVKFFTEMMQTFGHSGVQKDKKLKNDKARKDLIDDLFINHSDKKERLFSKGELDNIHADTAGLFLETQAVFHNDVVKNVKWKATSGARPKENINLQFAAYIS